MAKPWIGIPTRYHDKSEYIGQVRHYLEAVIAAGGLPLMIPSTGDRGLIAEYLARVDGILLPDIPALVQAPVIHDEDDEKPPARHIVRIEEGSLIRGLAGRAEMEVNSY